MRISPFFRNQYKPVPFKSQQLLHSTFRTCLHSTQQPLQQVVGMADRCSRCCGAPANQGGTLSAVWQSHAAYQLPASWTLCFAKRCLTMMPPRLAAALSPMKSCDNTHSQTRPYFSAMMVLSGEQVAALLVWRCAA